MGIYRQRRDIRYNPAPGWELSVDNVRDFTLAPRRFAVSLRTPFLWTQNRTRELRGTPRYCRAALQHCCPRHDVFFRLAPPVAGILSRRATACPSLPSQTCRYRTPTAPAALTITACFPPYWRARVSLALRVRCRAHTLPPTRTMYPLTPRAVTARFGHAGAGRTRDGGCSLHLVPHLHSPADRTVDGRTRSRIPAALHTPARRRFSRLHTYVRFRVATAVREHSGPAAARCIHAHLACYACLPRTLFGRQTRVYAHRRLAPPTPAAAARAPACLSPPATRTLLQTRERAPPRRPVWTYCRRSSRTFWIGHRTLLMGAHALQRASVPHGDSACGRRCHCAAWRHYTRTSAGVNGANAPLP